MSRKNIEQTIALAALFQAATLVDQIARTGRYPKDPYECNIASLFATNPETTEAIYGGANEIRFTLNTGLTTLADVIEKRKNTNEANVVRYVLSMIQLERKLAKTPEMLNTLGSRIEQIRSQAAYFSEDADAKVLEPDAFVHTNVIANIASLYQDTISTFTYKIHVGGDPQHLKNSDNAARIRALLLSGIRAAMLWRQTGGHRWHLLFFKAKLRPAINQLLAPPAI